ncbi:MAG: lytic transglycosylase domain-containing protein [Acidobacteriia bacterium]|nr:lytic transglycosylase domain-containing protein [Terriglobia bacterium]
MLPETVAPQVVVSGTTLRYPVGPGVLLAEVGQFSDELSAYLQFDYIRSRPDVDEAAVFLEANETAHGPDYRVTILAPNDAVTAIPYLAGLEARAIISGFKLVATPAYRIPYLRQQTAIFVSAYNRPVRRKLDEIDPHQLAVPVSRFIQFKSRTDPRVRLQPDFPVGSLTRQQATEFAADVIAVARFYSIPLDVFLGIGAMENNYLDVQGDLEHTTWKRKAEPGDIVLKRRRGRVLVKNYSLGPWQITRETLRYAHELFLHDKRDYSALPERLRPSRQLNFDSLDGHVLTTYAGLLLRDLLDHFDGDIEQAVGAYNGGISNPNLQYAAGVQQVAQYARSVLVHVSGINEAAIVNTRFVSVSRPGPHQPARR